MKATQKLHDLGQSLWLDNITRDILDDGTLKGYIDELSVTGLTSNPTIFDKAITEGHDYDEQVGDLRSRGLEPEPLFFEVAITDLRRAADLFKPVHDDTDGVDGYVSLEVSPELANDTEATVKQAAELHGKAERENLYIDIGDARGPARDRGHDLRRHPGERDPAVRLRPAPCLRRRLHEGHRAPHRGGARPARRVGRLAVHEPLGRRGGQGRHRGRAQEPARTRDRQARLPQLRRLEELRPRQEIEEAGGHHQRLLWASTGTKGPDASDTLYIEGLASPDTVNTMPEKTLFAFADHGEVGDPLPEDGGDGEEARRSSRTRASTSTGSRTGSRSRVPPPSSSPGTT